LDLIERVISSDVSPKIQIGGILVR
jgi:hypothetical protein